MTHVTIWPTEHLPLVLTHAMDLTDDPVLVARLAGTQRGSREAKTVIGHITHTQATHIAAGSPLAWWAGGDSIEPTWQPSHTSGTLLEQLALLRSVFPSSELFTDPLEEWLHLNELAHSGAYQVVTHSPSE